MKPVLNLYLASKWLKADEFLKKFSITVAQLLSKKIDLCGYFFSVRICHNIHVQGSLDWDWARKRKIERIMEKTGEAEATSRKAMPNVSQEFIYRVNDCGSTVS
jgi:hypothetical protein